jgi:hypothetical protein
MPKCCSNCFYDNELREFIDSNGSRSRCGFCGSLDVKCINPVLLSHKFEWLFSVTDVQDNGRHVADFLDFYFQLFSDSVQDKRQLALEMFDEQIFNGKLVFQDDGVTAEQHWCEFKDELISENRYFPKREIYKSFFSNNRTAQEAILANLLEQLAFEIYPTESFYRARVSDEALDSTKMGAPPKHLASSGRANPNGISYLYVAENIETAISEVRPYKGSQIFVSECKPVTDIKLIDLTRPRRKSSPFQFDEDNYSTYLYIVKLLESFSNELSIPVKPHKSELEYIPTQYVCEYIKSLGVYRGIVYGSSFGRGKNYVIFDESDMQLFEPSIFNLTDIQLSFDPV